MEQRRVEADPDCEVRLREARERNQDGESDQNPRRPPDDCRIGQDANERRRRERAGQPIDCSSLIEQGGRTEEKASRGLGHARRSAAVAMAARNAESMTMRGRAPRTFSIASLIVFAGLLVSSQVATVAALRE